jgi:putative transposase
LFGFAAGESRTLAGFRRSYNSTADETISPGGFYHRLTPSLSEYLRELVERGLDEVAVHDAVDTDIDRFRDVMIADGTVLRLHEFLSDEFQARHEEQAGAKLHLLHNATDQTIERLDVTDEKTHDSTLFKMGSWLCGRLVLFDLAYFKYRRFALIDENDGYFVSRLKQNANPEITEELREWRGRAIPLEGKQDVVDELSRKYIDVAVEAEFKRGQYEGTQSLDTKRFRVVGRRPRRGRRRLPSLHHEPPPRGVLAGGSSDVVSVSVGGGDAVPRVEDAVRTGRVRHEQPCCRGNSAVRGVAVAAGEPRVVGSGHRAGRR